MQIQTQPLSPTKQESLSKWLDQPAFDILIEVLQAGRFDVQLQAANLREHEPDTVAVAQAVSLDERARDIGKTIVALNSIRAQKEFTVSTATP